MMMAADHEDRESRSHPVSLSFVPGVGAVLYRRLIERFGSAEGVFKAGHAELSRIEGMSARILESITGVEGQSRALREIRLADRAGVDIIPFEDLSYPKALRNIYDSPSILFRRGADCLDGPCVAVVGSRKPTRYGIRMAGELAGGLARRGFTIVSGMAYGIDSAAHRGALEAGGKTVAVFGSGVDVVYPKSNRSLCSRILENGAVLSEYVMGTMPQGRHFPARNRIISGLSLGVVVVEAAERSGSLITAFLGLEQNREVYAVPGPADATYSRGTNWLIKQGAKLVQSVDDVINELPELRDPADRGTCAGPPEKKRMMTCEEKTIMEAIGYETIHIDELAGETGMVVKDLSAALLSLELDGLVTQMEGKHFSRT
ncbi:DNA-processing protein DprA [Thermodesulfobacteriota bacterium]